MKRDRISYDETFQQGFDYGAITCPKCNCKVLYGLLGTRPKYCPTCQQLEYNKFAQSLHFSRLAKDQKHKYIMDELRMPMPTSKKRTVQELVSDVTG